MYFLDKPAAFEKQTVDYIKVLAYEAKLFYDSLFGCTCRERIVLHTLKERNLQKKNVTAPLRPVYRCCGLQAIKYCANSPLPRIGAQVPAWLAPMTDKQSLLPPRVGRIN
jgi:hypothetical protein